MRPSLMVVPDRRHVPAPAGWEYPSEPGYFLPPEKRLLTHHAQIRFLGQVQPEAPQGKPILRDIIDILVPSAGAVSAGYLALGVRGAPVGIRILSAVVSAFFGASAVSAIVSSITGDRELPRLSFGPRGSS